jgi:hypothetical protein
MITVGYRNTEVNIDILAAVFMDDNYLVNNAVSGADCNCSYDNDNEANTVPLFANDYTVDEEKEQNDTSSILARILM